MVRNGSRVTIEVIDDGRGTVDPGSPGAGAHRRGPTSPDRRHRAGNAGMRERAGIYGGTVEAGRTGGGGGRVHAELNCNGENATEYNAGEPRAHQTRGEQ